LLQEVLDPDGAALTTTYTFFEDPNEIRWHKIKSISYADGSWIKYDYDNDGNFALILRPWKDLTLESATEDNSRATRYTYSNSDGIITSFTPKFVSTMTEKNASIVVGTTTYGRTGTSINGNPAVVETQRVYSSVSNNQVTVTTTYHSSATEYLANRLVSVELPDGRKDTSTYEKGDYLANADPSLSQFTVEPNGLAERDTVTYGTSTFPDGIAFKTNKKTTVRDQSGNQVLEETYVFNGTGYERVGWTVCTYDGRGHVTQTIRHNGQVSSAVWNGDRQASGIAESGFETTYTYDALGRIKDSTKKGIAAGGGFPAQPDIVTTTIYDAEGHLTRETVSSGGPSLNKFNAYDLAGRIKTSTDEAGLVTTYTYSTGGRTQTVTRPGGATEISDRYLDGQTKSVTGTARSTVRIMSAVQA
jgi:YD repeat-containing protein